MKKFYSNLTILFLLFSLSVTAQQLPNSQFEDWSGEAFDGVAQPASWNYSNVTQLGFKFNFAHKESGRSGSCIMIQDQDLEVAGIGETSPGYIALGHPWVYIESLTKVSEATAGTYGGISWSYRPDTMSVWVKRSGNAAMNEDFHLLYYSWSGTAHGDKYKGKNGKCTEVSWDDEESDVRQSTNGNECGTTTAAHQVAEGWWRQRAVYNEWTQIKVPIYYVDDVTPTKMNVIFSASNYPNFRANDGLYAGNSLFVDDVELIYSSKIHKLYLDGSEWKAFNPNTTAVQTYVLGDGETSIPAIKAYRGSGQLTNTKGITTTFLGRQLQGKEISITPGVIDETPTLITVRAEDGKSETTYSIFFMHKASNNAYLSGIQVNGQDIKNFNPYIKNYVVDIPYGSTEAPVVQVFKQEDNQTIDFTQPTSIKDVTTITVTAADHQTTQTYTIAYKEAPLSDNTLEGILVNGVAIPDFVSTKTSYKVSIPLGTTEMPTVEAISKYPIGMQTITLTAPEQIEGGVYQIAVTTPGNATPKIYKITFKLELSSYCKLQGLMLDGVAISNFSADNTTYLVELPVGTTQLPAITYVPGDPYQTIEVAEGGQDGTTRITVTAASGDKLVYKIIFSTAKSEISTLNGILINSVLMEGFDPTVTNYSVQLPMGTTTLPAIDVVKGDEYQKVTIIPGSIQGTTRITVSAGNGSTTTYQITFTVAQSTNATLLGITLDSTLIAGFDPNILEYTCILPQGTKNLPIIGYTPHDSFQTITTHSGGINGDYKITVHPQTGASQTYIIHFKTLKSSDTSLDMIYADGQPLAGFDTATYDYVDTLNVHIIPIITYKARNGQKVISYLEDNTYIIQVTAENGDQATYTITYVVRKSASALLKMIYLDGDSLNTFQPSQLSYSNLPLQSGQCPLISVSREQGQQISILSPAGAGTASIIVTAENGDQNIYLLHFVDTTSAIIPPLDPDPIYVASSDNTLATILIDGDSLNTYQATDHNYSLQLSAGSGMPAVTFVPNTNKQTVVSGQTAYGMFSALVIAENGDTATYTVQIQIEPYDNAFLQDIQVEGQDIAFAPTTLVYHCTLTSDQALPQVTYKTNPGQTVMLYPADNDQQQLIVTAESGRQVTYIIYYARKASANALLRDILVDGVSLPGFDSLIFTYTDTLAWRTPVVPSVNAVGAAEGQTITTYFSAVNGVTRIHVVAEDGKTTADYAIAFPTRQSGNVALNDLSIEADYAVALDFDPNQTNYNITVPFNATMSPRIRYEKGEAEQRIATHLRPIGQANQIIVKAENGDSRIYAITFTRAAAPDNTLKAIYIGEWNGAAVDLSDSTKRDFTINLPYGATSLSVSYVKQYDEQSVIVQPGGILRPTILTVWANNTDQNPTIYTLRPELPKENPASLLGITIDGEQLEHFDPKQYTYIVNRASSTIPTIEATPAAQAGMTKTVDLWKSIITVSCGEYVNKYSIYFHYPNEVIPNGEFDEWSTTATSNSDKPTSWNVPGDYLDVYAWTAKASESVKKGSNSIVHLSTVYWGALYGAVPPVMNLADMSANFAVAGGTTVTPSGAVAFHNTPDNAVINYHYPNKAGNGALFKFQFTNINGDKYTKVHQQTSETSTYQDYQVDFATQGMNIAGVDIIVDGTGLYPKAPIGPTTDCSSDLYIDYIRFGYNNRLTSVLVNNIEAARNGNAFSMNLKSSEDIQLPTLSFVGEVEDQAQVVRWDSPAEEGQFSVRRATIRNYGEDGNFSEYTLEVKRPLSTNATLRSIQVGGKPLAGFTDDQLDYTYVMPYGSTVWPDVVPVLSGILQNCIVTRTDSVISIQVIPEKGDAQTYHVRFLTEAITDASLADISAEGIAYDPLQTQYTIASNEMPDISIEKRYDNQAVDITNGIITVQMNGTAEQQYRIELQEEEAETSGQLKELELDDDILDIFKPDTYTYQHPLPTTMSFTRQDKTDSVIYIRKPDTLQWRVIGSQEHVYTMFEPTTLSSSTDLAGIYVKDALIEGFTASTKEYTLYTDSALQLTIVGQEKNQTINIEEKKGEYSITVTAEDGTIGTPYSIKVEPTISADASLAYITLDGILLPGFNANTYDYSIVLPAGAYKDHEPVLPTISYQTANNKATVEIEAGQLGETTNLFVTAQDGIHKLTYKILFTAEPSHNASLTNIVINNIPLDGFSPERTYYAVQMNPESITLDWRSNDRFQTISQSSDGNIYTIEVVAQDGFTKRNYVIQIFPISLSDDATLGNILLDGDAMSNYLAQLNTDLNFQSGMNTYTIYIPSGQEYLPEVTAIAKIDGQNMQIRHDNAAIYIDVTAPDGLNKNTYTLHFVSVLSDNTSLGTIFIDGDSLQSFQSDQYLYFIDLPVSTYTLPQIFPLKGDKGQQITTDTTQITIGQQYTISVLAEDGVSAAQYILIFQVHPSDADTLKMIYANGDTIEGFSPHIFNYYYELPYNAQSFPELTYVEADTTQTITLDTLEITDLTWVCQYVVRSESGLCNRYTISYTKLQSDTTTLQMIYLNGDSLLGFQPDIHEYIDTLPAGTTLLPTVSYMQGNSYQTIVVTDSVSTLFSGSNPVTRIVVTAQNGDSSIYTICFMVAHSTDATLNMIYFNGNPTPNFDELDSTYTITLSKGANAQLPAITFDKKYDEQIVDIQITDSNQIIVVVTAEDRNYQMTYYLTFLPYLSDNGLLDAIYTNGELITDFDPMRDNYEITIDSLSHLPAITYDKAEKAQQVYIQNEYTYTTDSLVQDVIATLVVVPENLEDTAYYEIVIHIQSSLPMRPEDSDNARLQLLKVDGQLIGTVIGFEQDFDPDTKDYYIIYPVGSDPDLFFTDSSVTYQPQDSLASISAVDTEVSSIYDIYGVSTPISSCIHITVTAPNGKNSWTYNIHQQLLLDSLNRTTQIMVADYNGDMQNLNDFDPETYYYEYTLSDTRDNAPAFELLYSNTESRFAYYSFERDNISQVADADDDINYAFVNDSTDPTYHLCYHAENGTKYIYKIKFRRSEIKRAQKAMEGDVLIQHIAGSYQIAVASLRANVVFGLYDMNGSMIELAQLGEGNPNSFNTITDGFGQTYFGQITDYSGCTILTLQPNKVYFWVFTENGKRKIKSGKIVIMP